jgi:phosphoribosylformylglycinamidine cyclo-ligase
MAHITGGGLEANCMRIIPKGLSINIDYSSWKQEHRFGLVASAGIEEEEMKRVFNLGIGYVMIASETEAPNIIKHLEELGESPRIIGDVIVDKNFTLLDSSIFEDVDELIEFRL